ncbi:Protein of unknown function [Bacillus wiedmannii]|nr:Protein of unknown function [Bacillus wiedmannii]
MFKGKE